MLEAIRREKQVKRWRRAWKLALIEAENPSGGTCQRTGSAFPRGRCHGRSAASRVEKGAAGSRLGALCERLAGMTGIGDWVR